MTLLFALEVVMIFVCAWMGINAEEGVIKYAWCIASPLWFFAAIHNVYLSNKL